MAKINSCAKGKHGEREFAALLRSYGLQARRGQQFSGVNGDADVVHSIPGVHLEVKRVEKLNVVAAFTQAARDAGPKGDMPIVCHRRNRGEWLMTMKADDFLKLIRLLDEFEAGGTLD
jgi:Holliday junction resolvase